MRQKYHSRRSGLFSQLLTGFAIALTAAGLTTLWLNYCLVESSLDQEVQEEAETIARSLEFFNQEILKIGGRQSLQKVVQKYAILPEVTEVWVIDANGQPLAHTLPQQQRQSDATLHPELRSVIQQVARTGEKLLYRTTLHGKSVIVYLSPTELSKSSQQHGVIVAAIDKTSSQQEAQQIVLRTTVPLGIGILLILSVLSFLVRKVVLKPLDHLNQAILASHQTGEFSLSTYLPDNEIKFLAETFSTIFYQQQQTEKVLQQRAEQLRNQNILLSTLAKHQAISRGNLKEAIQEITKVTACLLDVERASVWLYDSDKTHLLCLNLFELTSEQHCAGISLRVADYPTYIRAIDTEENLIVAQDARRDPRTVEFAATYLIPLDIHSMLDAPIRLEGKTVGVLCIEQVATCRCWSPEDESFVRSIADLIALAIEARDRKQAEQALKQSEQRNQALIHAQPDLLIRMRADGTYLDVANGGNVKLLRPDRMHLGVSMYDMLPPDKAQERMFYIQKALETQEVQIYEYPFEIDHQIRIEEARIVACGSDEVLVIVRDITDRKQAEQLLRQQAEDLENALQELRRTQTQMIQSEKMSSLGQMVAGIAHEINNPVNFIYGNIAHATGYVQDLLSLLSLYQQGYSDASQQIQAQKAAIDLAFLTQDLPKVLSSMKVGADRIREIVQSLRTFSRLDESEFKAANLHEGIDSTLMILQHRLKARPDHPEIQILKQYGDIPPIECYPGQLNQVFMNILSNAIDAFDQTCQPFSSEYRATLSQVKPPTIQIRTEFVNLDRVRVCIKDNGPGISQKVKSKLFDPFFTTKPVGKGTGLGLSISYQIIVERHAGQLSCCSEPGQGAEFMIEIPARQAINSATLVHTDWVMTTRAHSMR